MTEFVVSQVTCLPKARNDREKKKRRRSKHDEVSIEEPLEA